MDRKFILSPVQTGLLLRDDKRMHFVLFHIAEARYSFCPGDPIARAFVRDAKPVKVLKDTALEVTDTG